MAWRLAELFVEVGARTGGLYNALAGVHANLLGLGKVGELLSAGLHKAAMAFTDLGMLGPAMLGGIAAATAAVAAGLAHCAFAAAHLQEAVAKVEQAFGTATPRVVAMADDLARRFGAVRREILDVAASFGLMLQGAGVTRELSASMSVALSRIAVDAASFFDVEMSEAIMRLQSGLSGEMEAVRRWGINLTETNVLNKARSLGFQAKDSQDLDQQTKTLVRYKLIMEGLSAAEGDAERSQYRLIGQWKVFTGQMSELGTNIGTIVAPALTLLVTGLNAILRYVNAILAGWIAWGKALIQAGGNFFGLDLLGTKQADEQRKAIDERIARTEKDRLADDAAAQATMEADAKKKDPKGWMGGLEEWARHLQEAAWGQPKDKVAKDQLREQMAMKKLLEAISNKLNRPAPAVVGP